MSFGFWGWGSCKDGISLTVISEKFLKSNVNLIVSLEVKSREHTVNFHMNFSANFSAAYENFDLLKMLEDHLSR